MAGLDVLFDLALVANDLRGKAYAWSAAHVCASTSDYDAHIGRGLLH
jgi:hypothetical protein